MERGSSISSHQNMAFGGSELCLRSFVCDCDPWDFPLIAKLDFVFKVGAAEAGETGQDVQTDSEEKMPSFDEWKQEMLAEQKHQAEQAKQAKQGTLNGE